MLYFINSTLSFRLSFKASYKKFNKHLFFPMDLDITNVFKKLRLLMIEKKKSKRPNGFLKGKKSYLLKSAKLY